MATQIFVNLPVQDLGKSMNFFESLGFAFNPQFTDETAACMVVSANIYVMLLTNAKFKEFTPKEICDATRSTEVLVALSCESQSEVDELVRKAIATGGSTYNDPKDYGFMYTMDFRTWMATFGNSSTWSRCRLSKPRKHSDLPRLPSKHEGRGGLCDGGRKP